MSVKSGPLAGIRVIELAGIGPAPFACMLLADMGAEVILIERPQKPGSNDPLALGKNNILNRGKRSICIDLKNPGAAELVLKLLEHSDVLVEGLRPGVMESLGLGPDVCLARQPKLIFGRMTGWGQNGPLAQSAGHDINYIALSGALWYASPSGEVPIAPPTLVGDLGGGALYLAMGILAALLNVKAGGAGQVIDAAIVDGSANLMNLLLSFHAGGTMPMARGAGLLDGPYWYGTYRCADDKYVTIGALEPKFYLELLEKLGLAEDPVFARSIDASTWAAGKEKLTTLFASAPQAHWCKILEGSDACFAPVLDPKQAAQHPQLVERSVYQVRDGVFQAAPAPRFSGFPHISPGSVALPGQDWASILSEFGVASAQALAAGMFVPESG
ncbi:MAG: CaiB/BaiF CoA-transferase family protein [Rhodocyclaceae bacterium]|nr:CaiB/BaiF CoA-transferase family protein [Rhodocyclaceae bacterium]